MYLKSQLISYKNEITKRKKYRTSPMLNILLLFFPINLKDVFRIGFLSFTFFDIYIIVKTIKRIKALNKLYHQNKKLNSSYNANKPNIENTQT